MKRRILCPATEGGMFLLSFPGATWVLNCIFGCLLATAFALSVVFIWSLVRVEVFVAELWMCSSHMLSLILIEIPL